MQGNLKQIALPEVLQFISMGKSTGTLTVRGSSNVETVLMILQGRIINSSALERQRRLGDLLVHRGILKRSVLAQALTIQRTREPDKKIGEILIERDLIQEEQIREVLRIQLEEEIWNLFALNDGEFKFEQKSDGSMGEILVQIDIEPLLLEGSRRQDEWQQITSIIPDDRLVVGVCPYPENQEGRIPIGPADWRVFAQVNGKFPVRAIINRAGIGRFEVYKILVQLMDMNLVYLKEPEEGTKEAVKQIEKLQEEMATATPMMPSKGVGGLFSRLTGGGRKDEASGQLHFVTPIGSIGYIINKMVDRFFSMKEMKITNRDNTLIAQLWEDLLISFPRADLITTEGRHVRVEKLEGFLAHFEFAQATQDCYEDSLEAILQLLEAIFRIFAQRVGDRAAGKVVKEILENAVPNLHHQYGGDLKLEERIQMVLRLAA